MSLETYKTDNKLVLILFIKVDCEFCSQAVDLIEEISQVDFRIYVVMNSRISSKIEIRPAGEPLNGLPLLLDENEIPEVPCLYDPILQQRMCGVNSIENYLIDTGLI